MQLRVLFKCEFGIGTPCTRGAGISISPFPRYRRRRGLPGQFAGVRNRPAKCAMEKGNNEGGFDDSRNKVHGRNAPWNEPDCGSTGIRDGRVTRSGLTADRDDSGHREGQHRRGHPAGRGNGAQFGNRSRAHGRKGGGRVPPVSQFRTHKSQNHNT